MAYYLLPTKSVIQLSGFYSTVVMPQHSTTPINHSQCDDVSASSLLGSCQYHRQHLTVSSSFQVFFHFFRITLSELFSGWQCAVCEKIPHWENDDQPQSSSAGGWSSNDLGRLSHHYCYIYLLHYSKPRPVVPQYIKLVLVCRIWVQEKKEKESWGHTLKSA